MKPNPADGTFWHEFDYHIDPATAELESASIYVRLSVARQHMTIPSCIAGNMHPL